MARMAAVAADDGSSAADPLLAGVATTQSTPPGLRELAHNMLLGSRALCIVCVAPWLAILAKGIVAAKKAYDYYGNGRVAAASAATLVPPRPANCPTVVSGRVYLDDGLKNFLHYEIYSPSEGAACLPWRRFQ